MLADIKCHDVYHDMNLSYPCPKNAVLFELFILYVKIFKLNAIKITTLIENSNFNLDLKQCV